MLEVDWHNLVIQCEGKTEVVARKGRSKNDSISDWLDVGSREGWGGAGVGIFEGSIQKGEAAVWAWSSGRGLGWIYESESPVGGWIVLVLSGVWEFLEIV